MSDTRRLSRKIGFTGSVTAVTLLMGATAGAADSSLIAEVLVTAQKRSENLQDVPASVSVFDTEKLIQLHATQLNDYAAYLPGVNIASGGTPGQTTITLRGVAPIGPGSVVGTYIDDTPLGSSANYARATTFALDLMPYDVERVEVLRGPQGTLYGAGAMGGLLKYVLRDPNLSEFEFRVGAEGSSVGNADDLGWGVRAALNAPLISQKLAFRASFFDQETPGFIDNAETGEEGENEVTQRGGRAALLWQLSEKLSLKLGGTWQRVKSDNNSSMTLALTGIDPPTGARLGDLKSSHLLPQPFEKDVDYYSATLDWDLGWGSFVSATSYSKTQTLQIQDATKTFGALNPLLTEGAIAAGPNVFALQLDLKKWTQEFRLASASGGAIEWLIGAFYTDEDSTNQQLSVAFDDNFEPIPAFAPAFAYAALPSTYRELAGFGDLTFKFNERFDLTAGVRWARNEQDFRQITGGAILPLADDPGEASESVVTWAVSPRLHLSEDTMIYARVATGYRPGGPGIPILGAPASVDSDELTNYEAGIKTEFLDGSALLNLSAFYIDWKDIQQIRAFGGISALDNAGDAKSTGFELESAFSPVDGLRLGVNAAYTDATIESSPAGIDNKIGSRLPLVPEWSASFTADYNFSLFGGRPAHVGGGYRYVGERESNVVTVSDNLSYVLPSYNVVDLNADVTFNRMTLRLFAKNLTDERAYTGGGVLVDGINRPVQIDVSVIQPRTFGISMDFIF